MRNYLAYFHFLLMVLTLINADEITTNLGQPNPNAPELVGNFNGKFYFSSNTTLWQFSLASYCENEGMSPVTVETQAELAYLTSYYGNITIPAGTYWTGGQNTNSYAWSDGSPVEGVRLDRDFVMCLCIRGANAAGERLWGVNCYDYYKPLCQTRNPPVCNYEGFNINPYAGSCTPTFFWCIDNGFGGWTIHFRECAPGTNFNEELRACTYPELIPGC